MNIKEILEKNYHRFNQPRFVIDDPISIPKQFSQLQDIEIMAFWVAMLAWGNRKSIINSGRKLAVLMDNAPYDFVMNHEEKDLARFDDFKHRTFQPIDALYFISFFKNYYKNNSSLEFAFSKSLEKGDMKQTLTQFHEAFFEQEYAPQRTRKHIATPARKSACKRLNMFLRWMVRIDDKGVDFGLWSSISPASLMIPLDVHVGRVARSIGLLARQQNDWNAVEELTGRLREFCPEDPVKYDFALFGLGVLGEKNLDML